jgi:hypothetical protein
MRNYLRVVGICVSLGVEMPSVASTGTYEALWRIKEPAAQSPKPPPRQHNDGKG